MNVFFRVVSRQRDRFHLRRRSREAFHHRETIHPGHADIHQNHVRLQLFGHPDRLFAVCGFTDKLDSRARQKSISETLPEERVIFHNKNPDPIVLFGHGLDSQSRLWGGHASVFAG